MSFFEERTLNTKSNPAAEIKSRSLVTDLDRLRLRQFVREKLQRQSETTRLYEPLPNQIDFHKSTALERMLRGSNQAGKSLAAAMEISWIVKNRHPYLKYPKKGTIIAVGSDERHIGNLMWARLTEEDSDYRRIRDLETGMWRSYRRYDQEDRDRFDETLPMLPLIPQRLIDGEPAWYSKKENIPKSVRFKTGWKILFFTGGGKPPQGVAVEVVWFDEELANDEIWYSEMAARILRKRGTFFWSATAQAGGDTLWRLHQRAMEEEGSENPSVTEHPILLSDNPHISDETKDELKKKYAHDPDAYRVRILGEYLITSFHIYPTFAVTLHCCEPFEIPDNWCRYMIVDPGTVVAAVLFVAVPPDESHVYCYDEIYLRDSDPSKWIEAVRQKADGQLFQSFIIDDNGSRRTDASSGTTVRQVYAELLRSRNIQSRATGSSFELGASNVLSGLDKVRQWLVPKKNSKDGKPYVQIFLSGPQGCPHLVEEIQRYHRKRNKTTGMLTDEPVNKHNHQCDNLRYAAMHGCRYIEPKVIKKKSRGRRYLDAKRKKKKQKGDGRQSIILG